MIIDSDWTAPNAIIGAAFALYGAALFGTAQHVGAELAARLRLALGVDGRRRSACSPTSPGPISIAAGGSLLVLLVPGVILLRREPSAIV